MGHIDDYDLSDRLDQIQVKDFLPSAIDQLNMLKASKLDDPSNDFGKHPLVFGFAVFDHGGYKHDKGKLPDEQRHALLALFDEFGVQGPKNFLMTAAITHVHDRQFWLELIERYPQVCEGPYALAGSRAMDQDHEEPLARIGWFTGNATLCRLGIDGLLAGAANHKPLEQMVGHNQNTASIAVTRAFINDFINQPGYARAMMQQYIEEDRLERFSMLMRSMRARPANVICMNELCQEYASEFQDMARRHISGGVQDTWAKEQMMNALHVANVELALAVDRAVQAVPYNKQDRLCIAPLAYSSCIFPISGVTWILNQLQEKGFDLNTMVHAADKHTAAHKIGDQLPRDDFVQIVAEMCNHGLDLNRKDKRNWTGYSYMSKEYRAPLKAMEKAKSAKSVAQDALADIRKAMQP